MATADIDRALFIKWRNIINRCYGKHTVPNIYERHNIQVSDEWTGDNGYENFKSWALENGYSPELVIDRIDTLGDYGPRNCRFITTKENNRNRVDTVIVTYQGVNVKLCELCERLNIPRNVVYSRIRSGHTAEEAVKFDKPYSKRKVVKNKHRIALLRQKAGMSQREVAKRLGVTPAAVALWDTGKTIPRGSLLPMVADLYGVTVDELLRKGGDEKRTV